MQMAVIKHFPFAKVRYEFINRGGTQFPDGFGEELRKQIKMMEDLALQKEEKTWFAEKCPFLTPTYMDFLNGYRFDSSEVITGKANRRQSGKDLGE